MTETYDEIKTKTINWCQSLLDNKIYDQKKYNDCVSNFVNLGVNELPGIMDLPPNGNEFEYGLYGRKKGTVESGVISTDVNNKIMLSTTNNLYLISDENGVLTAVSPDSLDDQIKLQWTLVKSSNNQYSLMSRYNSFLGCDDNGRVHATRKDISNSTIWTFNAINEYVTIESVQYAGMFLTAESVIKLSSNGGESQKWRLVIVPKPGESLVIPFDTTPLLAKKENLLGAIEVELKNKYTLLAEATLIDSLIKATNVKYTEIMATVENNIETINNGYNSFIEQLKTTYTGPDTNISSLTLGERDKLASYTDIDIISSLTPDVIKRELSCSSRPIINGPCDYKQIYEINDAKAKRISDLTDIRSQLDQEIKKSNEKLNNLTKELDDMVTSLTTKTAANQTIITNNNMVMARQNSAIEQIQKDNIDLASSKTKLKESAEQAIENRNIADDYYNSNKYYIYVLYSIMAVSIVLIVYMIFNLINTIGKNYR
jgi:Skp family chaperone for outer membrane proteins